MYILRGNDISSIKINNVDVDFDDKNEITIQPNFIEKKTVPTMKFTWIPGDNDRITDLLEASNVSVTIELKDGRIFHGENGFEISEEDEDTEEGTYDALSNKITMNFAFQHIKHDPTLNGTLN